MKYEIVTHDGMTYEIQQDNPEVVARLASKLELIPVTLSNGSIEYFSKGNVARIKSNYKPTDDIQISGSSDNRGTVSPERIAELKAKAFNRV